MDEEIDALERVAAWRLRLTDANPSDTASAQAAACLEALAGDLRHNAYAELWTELGAITNWLAQSDAVSDFAELAEAYRRGIGVSAKPGDGRAYLLDLLEIARSLV